jgi:cytochrome-b5 reductase
MRYRRGWSKEIGMIAGGTGITPMFQLIRGICEDDKDLTQVSLIYANRAEGDILLRKELDRFATLYPQNFRLWYVLDSPSPQWQFGKGYITKAMIAEKLPSPSKDAKILLCGPPGMINASKKSLVELGFETPSAVSKMSDQVFCF